MSENNQVPSPPPMKPKTSNQKLVTYVVVILIAYWLFGLFNSSDSESSSSSATTTQTQQELSDSPTPAPPAPTVDNRKTVHFIGQGGLHENTAPQKMSGTYNVVWRTNGACAYYADLNGTDVFSADSQTHGSNYIYDLTPDLYHMSMITGPAGECTWSAKFYPVK